MRKTAGSVLYPPDDQSLISRSDAKKIDFPPCNVVSSTWKAGLCAAVCSLQQVED